MGQEWLRPAINAFTYLSRKNNNLCLSPEMLNLGADEKRSASEKLGEAFAKFIGERHLQIVQFSNLVRMEQEGTAKIQLYNKDHPKKGDFLGLDSSGDWHVIEAKGSMTGKVKAQIDQGKVQARNIGLINDNPPLTRSVFATKLNATNIHTSAVDPDSYEKYNVEIDQAEAFASYYSPFDFREEARLSHELDFNVERFQAANGAFQVMKLPGTKFKVGLEESVLESAENNRLRSLSEELSDGENISLGPDGVILIKDE